MYQEADAGDDEQEDAGKLIDLEGEGYPQITYGNEIEIFSRVRIAILYLDEYPDTHDERGEYASAADDTDEALRQRLPSQSIDQEAQ
jgi:hypothetical protein